MIIEPIQGEGGFIVPAPGFLPALAAWAAEHGVVLIADEIQTGFARTGAMFACEHEGVVPDLITTGQGDGRRAAAVGGDRSGRDHGRLAPGGLGGTYGGNPVACAAALAALDGYEQRDLLERARRDRGGDGHRLLAAAAPSTAGSATCAAGAR